VALAEAAAEHDLAGLRLEFADEFPELRQSGGGVGRGQGRLSRRRNGTRRPGKGRARILFFMGWMRRTRVAS